MLFFRLYVCPDIIYPAPSFNRSYLVWRCATVATDITNMQPLREQNKSNKRRAILNAAIKLFPQKGYHHTSIEELARQAGVGKGTVYSYFQTKKDIVRAFCEDELEQTRQALTTQNGKQKSLMEQLLLIFLAEFNHITEHPEFGRIYLQETVFPHEHYGAADLEVQSQYFAILYPLFERAQQRGELRDDLEMLHIAGHFRALNLLVLSCWYNGMLSTDEIPEALVVLITQAMNGLQP